MVGRLGVLGQLKFSYGGSNVMRVGTVTFFQIAGVLIVLSLGLPIPSEAVVFWDDSFEYANDTALGGIWGGLSSTQDPNGVLDVSTAHPHTGSKSIKETFTGTGQNFEGGASVYVGGRNFTPTNTLYTRWWMYLTDHNGTGTFLVGSPFTKLNLQYPDTCSVCYSVWWTLSGANAQLASALQHADGTTENHFSSGTVPQQQWVCVETQLTAESPPGASNGIMAAWINGTQVLNDTNVTLLKSGGVGPLTNVRLYTQNGLGTIYYDDYATGNSRIGCGASPTNDVTPPAAPVGLRVQ